MTILSEGLGLATLKCKAIIPAMGCRERNRGNINIPGSRPAGIMTAGLAQKLVNILGVLPGKEVLILGLRRYRADHGQAADLGGHQLEPGNYQDRRGRK